MRLKTILTLLLVFVIRTLFAQEVEVTIKATGTSREPLPSATIRVTNIADTTLVQEKVADTAGVAVFRLSQNLPYQVEISYTNYKPVVKNITVKENATQFVFAAEPASNSLTNIVVTAQRPLMRQEDDKTIVDPESLAMSSTNSYEIIEKTPGLFVDQDGNIYLNSTTPAKVFINGREQKMSAADMATVLKSLPPNAISSIEILRTPSARYDASGGGGIVNVILRKGIRIGLTGSINAALNQGVYGNQTMGFTLNNNNGRFSQNLNVQVSNRNGFERLESNRYFTPDSLLTQNAYTRYPAQSYFLGYGLGYQLSDKWEVNYDGRLSTNLSRSNSTNVSGISKVSSGSSVVNNEALIGNNTHSYNINQGLSFRFKPDDSGSEWTTDFNFNFNKSDNNQDFSTRFMSPQPVLITGDGTINNDLKNFAAQTNFLKKLPNRITVETGLKSSGVWFNNNTQYFRNSNGGRVQDNVRTGAYNYDENINAAYLQASKTFGKIILKAGSRLENTNMHGRQLVPRDTAFTVNRTDLFPYVYLSRNLMKIAGFDLKAYLVYRRTISRPAYEYLNPSQRYIDPYLFETGNPSLRPQFTNNFEANISVDERPIFAVGVNEQTDIFTQVLYQADSTRSIAYRTYDNLGKNKETYFRALGAIPPGRKFFFVAGLQYNHNSYQGLYESKPLTFERGSWSFFTYQQLRLTPNTQLSLDGFLRVNGQLQFYELENFGQLNFRVNQQFLNKKLSVSASVTDLFYTNQNRFTIAQGSLRATGVREYDSRRFGLNLRYNFGIRKKEENKMPDLDAMERTRP